VARRERSAPATVSPVVASTSMKPDRVPHEHAFDSSDSAVTLFMITDLEVPWLANNKRRRARGVTRPG
jgi:hypothetical protein